MNKTHTIIRLFFLLLTGELTTFGVNAQTARWAISPQYTSITPLDGGMYKVKSGSRVGILDNEGKTIVAVQADSITPLNENCALVLKREDTRYRLTGILHTDHKMISVTDEWYVADYPFFSEGKLPVQNKTGLYGYMNTNGNLVLNFEYGAVHPFSEGWAAVCKGKSLLDKGVGLFKKNSKEKVYYVDENGGFLTLSSDIGDIYSGTSFKNGEALVITKENKYCFINTSGQLMRIDNNTALIFDEKYALKTGKDDPKENYIQPTVYDGPATFTENALYGYQQAGKIILPAQFNEASPFSNNFAIATIAGKCGLLKLLPGDFECESKPGSLSTAKPGTESIDFMLTVPDDWTDGTLELTCKNPDGTQANSTMPGNANKNRVFSFILPAGERELTLSGENLIVWTSCMNSITASPEDVEISISPTTVKANDKDNAYISVTLKNNSSKTVEFTVEVTGSRLNSVNKKISLNGGQTEKISTWFTKVTEEESRTVTVSTSLNENNVSKRIRLEPFFVKY